MEEEEAKLSWHTSLKAPVVEVVDLLSEDESILKPLNVPRSIEKRDASDAGNPSDAESQWSESQWSLYEDILQEEDEDGTLHKSTDTFLPSIL